MEVINDLLEYNNMKIFQRTDGFNFSLDSVLLANFATTSKKVNTVVDLCCGNAPIPMMMSTKCKADFIGVEIQEVSYDLANKSIAYNKLEDRIKMYHADVVNINKLLGQGICELVTCNPPFFKVEQNHSISTYDLKQQARHEISVNFDQICFETYRLLKDGGYFAIVHRTNRFLELLLTLKKHNLEPKRIQFIYPKVGSESNIVLIEARKNRSEGIKVLNPIYVHDDNNKYLPEIEAMFK